jgi:hypothetical protein
VADSPLTRGELNWAISTSLIRLFTQSKQNYDAHCDIKIIVNEVIQGIMAEATLKREAFDLKEEVFLELVKIDALVWDYMLRTGDNCGAKQVLRDIESEWNRRMTSPYEDVQILANGDIFEV